MNKLTLKIENLTTGYGDKTVSCGLEAVVQPGVLTCLLGENGAGKSTLLRTIAGLQPPLGGRVLLCTDGGPVTDTATLSRSARSRLISVVLTEHPDMQMVTAGELVGMGRLPYTGFFGGLTAADRQLVDQAMELTGTQRFASRQINSLSDGERQKVMIAKALAQQTPVILLDEPTAFLDYPSKVEMMVLLRRLAREEGLTILLSTHDIDLALRHGDCFLTLHHSLRETDASELRCYVSKLSATK